MNKIRKIVVILLVGLISLSGLSHSIDSVLCIEEDGHIVLELSTDGNCDNEISTHDEIYSHVGECHHLHLTSDDSHCGDCIDIPLSNNQFIKINVKDGRIPTISWITKYTGLLFEITFPDQSNFYKFDIFAQLFPQNNSIRSTTVLLI